MFDHMMYMSLQLSVKGGVVEVELTVQLNGEVINVNDDVYLTDFVTTHSLHFSQATDPKVVLSYSSYSTEHLIVGSSDTSNDNQ